MLDKNYNPHETESEIYKKWEEKGLFKSDVNSKKPPFSLVMPPPNVTGSLHMGHALDDSLPDVVLRYKRMRGFDVMWQPGTDHAGIATQMVVERELAKEKISRHDLGREKFVEKVWEWKAVSGGKIIEQLRRLGVSADWSRQRFTMDEGLSKVVTKVFVSLYKEGLVYRDKRLVNWDSKMQTAISDIEVNQVETLGKMWYFNYPVEGSEKGEAITVATTRPETMFGDTAVAVSADDERYKHLIGKNVILPIVNRPIPVVADEHADPTKGSGAVKITPAHDFNDFEVGKRHNLPLINILDNNAKLNDNVPEEFRGLACLEARPLVLAKIKELGLFVKEEDNPMTIPYGDRSNVVIEPWLTDQWYVDAKKLAVKAMEVVKTKEIEFIPENWEATYFEWMNNIQPWCISRQLWWGHQIPVWYDDEGGIFCEETEEEALAAAEKLHGKKVALRRDEDVLDTWFSSQLWPFATFDWPDESDVYFKRYYPTSLLVTGFDILFFWVARMIMAGTHLTGKVPFKQVFFHGLVRDGKGQKMSKSKNNGIDPLDMINKYGADALRFALLIQAGHGRDVLISDERCEAYRNFATKIWNAARFCEMNGCKPNPDFKSDRVELPINAWMINELFDAADSVAKSLDNYEFNDACNTVYHFIWGEFCDWYLEMAKTIFLSDNEAEKQETRDTAAYVLDNILKILHPFMPFITEELWGKIADRKQMLMEQTWPSVKVADDDEVFSHVDWLVDFISAIRSTRAEVNIPAGSKISLRIKDATKAQKDRVGLFVDNIKTMARVEDIAFTDEAQEGAVAVVFDGMTAFIPLAGLIDVAKEKERLNKELLNLKGFVERTNAQLANEGFTAKAPKSVIEGKIKARDEAEVSIAKIADALELFKDIN